MSNDACEDEICPDIKKQLKIHPPTQRAILSFRIFLQPCNLRGIKSSTAWMTLEEYKERVLPLKDRLYRYALSMLSREELARDVVQEVLLKAWENRLRLASVKNLEAWFIRCTRNLVLDRRKAKDNWVIDLTALNGNYSPQIDPAQVSESKDLIEILRQLTDQLPTKQREVFRLRELAGYSNQEISEILQIDAGQVKVNLHRARKKVRSELKKIMSYGITECK